MNVEEIIKQLRWIASNDKFVFSAKQKNTYADLADLLEQQQAEINRLNDLLKDSMQGHLLDVLNRKENEIENLKKINENIRQESVHKSVYEAVIEENAKLKELLRMAVDDMTDKCSCCFWNGGKTGECQHPVCCEWEWQHQSEVDEVLKGE